MSGEKYDLVFKGEAVKGVSVDTAKQNLAKLFKLSELKVESLFTGKPVTLKRGLDLDTANKYRVAIKKAGARVNLVEQKGASAAAASVASTSKASAALLTRPVPETNPRTLSGSSEQVKVSSAGSTVPVVKKASTTELGLAPVGTPVLAVEERRAPLASVVSDVDFGLKQEGELLDSGEKETFTPLDIDLSSIDLAPVGADVLTAEERVVVPGVSVDTSGMQLAEPGVRLGEPKAKAPPPPSTAHLHLEGEV